MPILTLLFRNFYAALPIELFKAARVDGAGLLADLLLHHAADVGADHRSSPIILQVTGIWNDFLFGIVFAGRPNWPMTVQLNNIVNTTTGVREYNVNMAATILTAAVPLVDLFHLGTLVRARHRRRRGQGLGPMASVSIRKLGVGLRQPEGSAATSTSTSSEGEFVVLLGPSGCGKSTLLNAVAGLLDVNAGQVWIGGKNVTWEEPKDRGIGMVFQSYALYPRMTAEGNMSFGLKMARVPRAEIASRVARAAEILQIEPLLKRRPAELSGGQRQRVAIGRALVRDVDVFLFDEPLSNLDAKLRTELRVELKRLHQQLGKVDDDLRHARPDRGADACRPHRGHARRRHPAARHAAQDLPPARRTASSPGFVGSPDDEFPRRQDQRIPATRSSSSEGVRVPLSGYPWKNGIAPPGRRSSSAFGPNTSHRTATIRHRLDAEVELVEPMGAETILWCRIAGAAALGPRRGRKHDRRR